MYVFKIALHDLLSERSKRINETTAAHVICFTYYSHYRATLKLSISGCYLFQCVRHSAVCCIIKGPSFWSNSHLMVLFWLMVNYESAPPFAFPFELLNTPQTLIKVIKEPGGKVFLSFLTSSFPSVPLSSSLTLQISLQGCFDLFPFLPMAKTMAPLNHRVTHLSNHNLSHTRPCYPLWVSLKAKASQNFRLQNSLWSCH